jgi:hypothetical protein
LARSAPYLSRLPELSNASACGTRSAYARSRVSSMSWNATMLSDHLASVPPRNARSR